MRSKVRSPRKWARGYMDGSLKPQAKTKPKRLLASNKEALQEARREALAAKGIPVPDE